MCIVFPTLIFGKSKCIEIIPRFEMVAMNWGRKQIAQYGWSAHQEQWIPVPFLGTYETKSFLSREDFSNLVIYPELTIEMSQKDFKWLPWPYWCHMASGDTSFLAKQVDALEPPTAASGAFAQQCGAYVHQISTFKHLGVLNWFSMFVALEKNIGNTWRFWKESGIPKPRLDDAWGYPYDLGNYLPCW